MIALLWKDIRGNLILWCVSFALVIVVFVLILAQFYFQDGHLDIMGAALSSLYASMAITVLIAATAAAQMIAGERMNKTLAFLYHLPPSRGKIAASKLIAGLALVNALVLVILALHAVVCWADNWSSLTPDFHYTLCAAILLIYSAFGLAWGGAAVIGNAALGFAFGILANIVAIFVYFQILHDRNVQGHPDAFLVFASIFGTLTLIGIAVGTVWFMRRIEP